MSAPSEPNICKHDRPMENCLPCLTDKAFKVSEPNICPTCTSHKKGVCFMLSEAEGHEQTKTHCPDPWHTCKGSLAIQPTKLGQLLDDYFKARSIGIFDQRTIAEGTLEMVKAEIAIEALIAKRERAVVDRLQEAIAPRRLSKATIREVLGTN